MRTSRRLRCPAVAVVGPCGGHEFWVQPALDLHLAMYPEAVPSIRRLAKGAAVEPIRPLVGPEFFERGDRERTRDELEVAPGSRLLLVSGGGWGAGEVISRARSRPAVICHSFRSSRSPAATRICGRRSQGAIAPSGG